jgi:glutamyl-tRNA reductase
MILLAIGGSHQTMPVALREHLAFRDDQIGPALDALNKNLGWEAVLLSTCNRVELYLGQVLEKGLVPSQSALSDDVADFLAEFHGLPPGAVRPHLYVHRNADAVRHLFKVASSLDSLVVGEGQISGQVKKAYERALQQGTTGPLLNVLFPTARRVGKRVRTETGISQGQASVSSAAVEYVRGVFEHFADKTVLVIGAGKMGELTLRHLRQLRPLHILVTNRSPEKAAAVARGCGGEALPWDKLDDCLERADIVLSTTGAPEPVVTRERWQRVLARRTGGAAVIFDIAVPRDFDPQVHDGDQTFLYNIDDLKRLRDDKLAHRRQHMAPALAIVEQEAQRFLRDWARRRNGPVIDRLTREIEAKRKEVVDNLLARLNGRLSEADQRYIEKAFCVFQNRLLDGPISALAEETHAGPSAPSGHTLLDALRKLFRLQE